MLKAVPLPGHRNPMLVTGNPVKFASGEATTSTALPALGEHTAELLTLELGLDPADVDKLVLEGIVANAAHVPVADGA
jgi:hypothetical protein